MDGARDVQDTKLILTPPPLDPVAPVTTAAPPPESKPTTTASPSAWKGRKVKRFKLVDELGEGAMGRVYIAEDTVLQRHVALKLLPARHRDGRPNHRTERLVREARSAASLEHPNTVTIHEIDEFGGVHYIAMELVEGGNLEKLVHLSGPMEIERACQLIAEAAEACHHAHSRGIIHRDIKPANLLLTRGGRCKVADFGLAAFDAPDDPHRLKCVGTPNFIPPEIALGRGAVPASDIYSLGCTLWFLLTGRPPFSGSSTRDVLKLHVKEPLPDLRKWRPDAPERLVQALQQACAKDPADRFPDADTFAKVLRTFTISTGGSPNTSGIGAAIQQAVAGPHGSGYVMLSGSGHVAPVGGSGPIPQQYEPARPRGTPTWVHALAWTGAGTIAATVLISLGVYMAKQPKDVASNSAPAVSTSSQAKHPGSLFDDQSSAANPSFAPAPTVAVGENALANGALNDAELAEGQIPGWYIAERCKPMIRTLEESGNRFMRIKNTDQTTTAHADQKIDVDPAWKMITVSARMRASNFKKTAKGASGVQFSFQDENGKLVGKYQPVLLIEEDTNWTDRVVTADIPAGARKVYMQAVVSYARGTIDFDDVKIVAAK